MTLPTLSFVPEPESPEETRRALTDYIHRYNLPPDRDNAAHFAICWLPLASTPHITTVAFGVTLAIAVDDLLGTETSNPDVQHLAERIMTGFTPDPADDDLALAFHEMWNRITENKPEWWTDRARTHWKNFIDAGVEETQNRADQKTLTPQALLELRIRSGWVYCMYDYIEHAYSTLTTEETRAVPELKTYLHNMVNVINVLNDIISRDKEAADADVHNYLLALEAAGHSPDQARQLAIQRVHEWTASAGRAQDALHTKLRHLPDRVYPMIGVSGVVDQ